MPPALQTISRNQYAPVFWETPRYQIQAQFQFPVSCLTRARARRTVSRDAKVRFGLDVARADKAGVQNKLRQPRTTPPGLTRDVIFQIGAAIGPRAMGAAENAIALLHVVSDDAATASFAPGR